MEYIRVFPNTPILSKTCLDTEFVEREKNEIRRLNWFVLCKLEELKLEHSCFGRYYAPALGFLMFAVGLNFSLKDFGKAFERPGVLAIGFFSQYLVKPLLAVVFAAISVSILRLPEAVGMSFLKHSLFRIIFFQYRSYISTLAPGTPCILVSQTQKTAMDLLPLCAGSGLILVACSSGAQLSNYATFLAEPAFAPLSIVMTALSTAAAVVVTPLLTLLLLGRRLHIDLVGMIRNITEIVVAPIAAGLFLNR
jgi:BASS family bile acid:Na+ symporter